MNDELSEADSICRVTMSRVRAEFNVDKNTRIIIAKSQSEIDKIQEEHTAVIFQVRKWDKVDSPDPYTIAFSIEVSGFNTSNNEVYRIFYPRVEIALYRRNLNVRHEYFEMLHYESKKSPDLEMTGRMYLQTLYPDSPLTVKRGDCVYEGLEMNNVYYVTKDLDPYIILLPKDLTEKFGHPVEVILDEHKPRK